MPRLPDLLSGHFWTIARDLQHRWRPIAAPPAAPWRTTIHDPPWGPVILSGRLRRVPGATVIAVIVHGLGGSDDSGYCVRAARACEARGWSCLRVNLRGADGRGEDIYHAGLVGDLVGILDSDAVASHEHVVIWGFSLGGHLALHGAATGHPRLRAVAAIGAPLDLARSCEAIDRGAALPYREHVLRSLKHAYRTVAAQRDVPTDPAEVDRIRTIRQWDELVVVPRYGFGTVPRYHASQSVGPRLGDLAVPGLYIGSRFDPMVPADTVEPSLRRASDQLTVHMTDFGGHVAFPDRIRLEPGDSALEHQVGRWLARQLGET